MEQHLIYFIYSNLESEESKIQIFLDDPPPNIASSLIPAKSETKEDQIKEKYNVKIYSIPYIQNKEEIKLILDYEKNRYISNNIKLELNRSNFIFDLKFRKRIMGENPKGILPKNLKIFKKEEFDSYVSFINKDKILAKYLVFDVILSIKNTQTLEFDLFIVAFFQCYFFPYSLELYKSFSYKNLQNSLIQNPNRYSRIISVFGKKKLLENLNTIQNENEKQNILLKYDEFCLYFYRQFEIENFIKCLKESKNKDLLFTDMFEHEDKFKGLEEKVLTELLALCGNLFEFEHILRLSKNLNEAMKFIINNTQKIEELNPNENPMHLEIYVQPTKDDNMSEFFTLYKNLNDITKSNNKIPSLSSEIFRKYMNCFKQVNYDNLYILNKHCQEFLDVYNKDDEQLSNDLQLEIHNTGIILIKQKKFLNNDILKFILSDNYYTGYINNKEEEKNLDFIQGIDIYKIDTEFILLFNQINFPEILNKDQLSKFTQLICQQINGLDDFHLIFKLFEPKKDMKKEIKEEIFLKFGELIMQPNVDKNIDVVNDISLTLFSLYGDKFSDKIFKVLKTNLPEDKLVDLSFKLLESVGDTYPILSEQIIKGLTEHSNFGENKSLIVLVNLLKEKQLKDFFNKLQGYSLQQEDFYSLENTKNFKFLEELVDHKYLGKGNEIAKALSGTQYFLILENSLKRLRSDLNNFNFYFHDLEKLKILKENNVLTQKLLYIYYSDKNQAYSLDKKLKDIIQKIFHDTEIKQKALIYYGIFYEKDIVLNENLSTISFQISTKKISDYINTPLYKQIISKIESEINDINLYNELILSNFFLYYYNSLKIGNYDETSIKIKAKQFFDNLINLVDKHNSLSFSEDQEDLKIILDNIYTLEGLKAEINFLKKYFHKENEDTSEIEKRLFLYINKRNIYSSISNIIYLLEHFHCKHTEFFKSLNLILNCDYEKIKIKDIEDNIKTLEKYKIDLLSKESYLSVLRTLNTKIDILGFLNGKNEDEMRNLIEFMDDLNVVYVNPQNIQDLIKAIIFYTDLSKGSNMEDSEFMDYFMNLCTKEKYKKIEVYLASVSTNYTGLKDLYSHIVDNEELSKKKLSKIFSKASFEICNFNDTIQINIQYGNDNKKDISFDDLKALRDGALLKKKTEGGKDNVDTFHESTLTFSKILTKIEALIKLLKELLLKGYPKNFDIKIQIVDNNTNVINEGEAITMDNLLKQFQNVLSTINNNQINSYQNEFLTTFLFGKYFYYLTFFIESKFTKFTSESCNIIKYISKNFINSSMITKNELLKLKFQPILINKANNNDDNNKINKELDVIMTNIRIFLKQLFDFHKVSSTQALSDSKIIKELKLKYHLYKRLISKNTSEKEIINLVYSLTSHIPIAQTTLICNENTSNEEIIAFFYRIYFCKENILFILSNCESLELEKRKLLLDLINEKITNNKHINATLLIFCFDRASGLMSNKDIKFVNDEIKEKDEKSIDIKNIEVIYSDSCGVGKSNDIRKIAESGKYNYIYFPIGGDFDRNDIINRLQNIEIKSKCKNLFHLDLKDTNKPELMREFLFSFLFLKFYSQNQKIFYLGNEIEIKVEIPYGFVNYFEKFNLLNLFKRKLISKNKLPKLIVPNDLTSNVQIVSAYLNCLESPESLKILNNKDLYIKGLTTLCNEDEINKSSFEVVNILSQEKCQELIRKYLAIENPTYYQINSFVNVLADQLKYLSNNIYLNAGRLKEVINSEKSFFSFFKGTKNSLEKLREFIVNAFILITQYFTKGAYGDLINNQNATYQSQTAEYNQNEADKKAIEQLSDREVVNFDKIKPSLVFFNEDGESFSIITTYKELSEEEIKKKEKEIYNKILKEDEINEYKAKKSEHDEYCMLRQLFNSNNYDRKVVKDLINYRDIKDQIIFLEEINKVLNLNKDLSRKEDQDELFKILESYIFTADNYIKMILILLRIRANIPVIMMGETGCGKTSLIKIIAKLKKNNVFEVLSIHAGITDKDIIQFMYDRDLIILDETSSKILSCLRKSSKTDLNIIDNKVINIKNKIWVFLDEINTCNSMGLISEMMCNHTIQGMKIKENVIFIGACNPYRQFKKDMKFEIAGLVKKQHQRRKLVYMVNPLPHSLLNFVFDFGNLTPLDEEKYIESMISAPISKYFEASKNKKTLEKVNETRSEKLQAICDELKFLIKNLISTSQNFIRDKNDKSSVSLREVRRFVILFEWFITYLSNQRKVLVNERLIFERDLIENSSIGVSELNEKGTKFYILLKHAAQLTIFICYFLRISNKKERKELIVKLNDILYNKKPMNIKLNMPKKDQFSINNIDEFNLENDVDFMILPQYEMLDIVNRIKLEQGIAKNRALLENVFTLFVCVNNKVPVFICGKPGCSKSLSVQLLYKSMKGESSEDPLFQSLPRLFMNSFQGSLGSTSEGVLNIFKKSRNVLKKISKSENIISMIYFDEMGLAEISENNPLKVIHNELEYDANEEKVAFVGISNWVLDASKMNRGIFLTILDPDEEDLKDTAKTIAKSYIADLNSKNLELFENLAKTYHIHKKRMIEENSIDQEFHGSRDFYHLIKIASRNLKKLKNPDAKMLETIGLNSIERNFGGLNNSVKKVKEIFLRTCGRPAKVEEEYQAMNCIETNIVDPLSRYLLIVSKGNLSPFLLSYILEKLDKNYQFLTGSQFDADMNNEYYNVKIINKIQSCMGVGSILVLKNLDYIYPALYDLFNQNFTSVGGKNYARIALGSSNNLMSYVDLEFRCIILIDENELRNQEAPFLNRFEKHVVNFEYILNENEKKLAVNIKQLLDELVTPSKPLKNLINIKSQLINCGLEDIQGLVYKCIKEKPKLKNNNKEIIKEIFKKIVPTFSQDILAFMKNSKLILKNKNWVKEIENIYKNLNNFSLGDYIKNLENKYSIVYTFSDILNSIILPDNLENKLAGKINKENIKEIFVSSNHSENEFSKELNDFYSDNLLKFCFIRFSINDLKHINHLKYFIDNLNQELNIKQHENNNIINIKPHENNNNKFFIFVIYLHREIYSLKDDKDYTIDSKNLISHLSSYNQIFIDNLNGNESNVKFSSIISKSNDELLDDKNLINFEKLIDQNLVTAVMSINYEFKGSSNNDKDNDDNENNNAPIIISKENYVTKLLDELYSCKEIKLLIKNTFLKSAKSTKESYFLSVFYKDPSIYQKNDKDFLEIFQKFLLNQLTSFITKFIVKCEIDDLLSILFNKELFNNKAVQKIWEEYIEMENFNSQQSSSDFGANNVTKYLGLNFPFSYINLKKIIDNISSQKAEFYENDIAYRELITSSNEELQLKINEFKFKEKELIGNVYSEIEKINIFELILKEVKSGNLTYEIFDFLNSDYLKIYIQQKFNCNYIEDLENILKLLLSNRFEEKEENDPFIILSQKILFLESYSKYVYVLLSIFTDIKKFIPNLFTQMTEKIKSGSLEIEHSERITEQRRQMNQPFFICLDSMLSVILDEKNNNIFDFKELKSFDFVKTIRAIVQSASQLETAFTLFSKELYNLISFIQSLELLFKKVDSDDYSSIKKYMNLLNKEKNLRMQNIIDNKDLVNCLIEQFDFLKSNIGDLAGFHDLIIMIFVNKFKQNKNQNYRLQMMNIVLSDNKLILKSTSLLKMIFNNASLQFSDVQKEIEDEVDNFLSFPYDENNLILELLENCKNIIFYDKLLFYFELCINCYFEVDIPKYFKNNNDDNDNNVININNNNRDIINNTFLGMSFEFFKKSIDFLEGIYTNSDDYSDVSYKHLGVLYSISYIQCYLNKLVEYDFKGKLSEINSKDIIKYIVGENNNELRKMFKIYIFKLYRQRLNSYDAFKKYDWTNKSLITWQNEFNLNEEVPCIFDYLFLNLENINLYYDIEKSLSSEISSNFHGISLQDFSNKLINIPIIIFIDVVINKILFNLLKEDYRNSSDYANFSKWSLKLLSNPQLSNYFQNDTTRTLLKITFDADKFKNEIFPKLKGMEQSHFEAFMYCYKLVLMCSLTNHSDNPNNNNMSRNYYNELLTKDVIKLIDNSYVPGREPNDDRIIDSYFAVEEFLNATNSPSEGAYICSCDTWYNIEKCGLPNGISKCPTCGKDIGGIKHKLVEREGHYRVYKTEAHRKNVEWRIYYKPLKWKYLDDLKKEVDVKINDMKKGIKKVNLNFFKRYNKNVRGLDDITFRILNMILYSCFYFDILLGNANNKDIKDKYVCENSSCMNMIMFNWMLLKKALKSKGVDKVQVFMNMIFNKFQKCLNNLSNLNKKAFFREPKEREIFEKEMDDIVKKCLIDYKNYIVKYNEINSNLLKVDINSMKSIIQELFPPENYDKNLYPYMEYFILKTYPSRQNLVEEINLVPDKLKKYPLIVSYLENAEDIEKLQNILLMNPFSNYMIQRYSYKISRTEAKELKIKDELAKIKNEIGDNLAEEMYKNFETGYNNMMNKMKDEDRKYACRPPMKKMILKNDMPIAYCLNDDGEFGFGMYIASMYENFKDIQNKFLGNILANINQGGLLHFFKDEISKEIMPQDASSSEVINLEFNPDYSSYQNLYEILSIYSSRNCYDDENKINYSNYKNIIYDLNSIEEELGKILLPGKRLFTDKQRFVTFGYECYFGNKSSIFDSFSKKYNPIRQLEKEEKIALNEFSKKFFKYTQFMFNLQMIIFYIDKANVSGKKALFDVVSNLPPYISISEECRLFFKNNTSFTISSLISIYEYFEFLCFPQIKENVNNEYKEKIDNETIDDINKYFNANNGPRFITKSLLASATRKMISRYLSGKRLDNDIKLEATVIEYLVNKEDLWSKEIFMDDRFLDDGACLSIIKAKIKQTVSFYDALGGDKEFVEDIK